MRRLTAPQCLPPLETGKQLLHPTNGGAENSEGQFWRARLLYSYSTTLPRYVVQDRSRAQSRACDVLYAEDVSASSVTHRRRIRLVISQIAQPSFATGPSGAPWRLSSSHCSMSFAPVAFCILFPRNHTKSPPSVASMQELLAELYSLGNGTYWPPQPSCEMLRLRALRRSNHLTRSSVTHTT